jgi:hypothetical protein
VVTFTRRRAAYLDWVEANTDPVAFRDDEETVGIAVGRRTQRVEVHRSGARLQLRNSLDEPGNLLGLIGGVSDCFEPERMRLTQYRAVWSMALESAYEETAARLAARSGVPSDYRPVDCAYLTTLRWPGADVDVEFGIVNSQELVERVTDPEISRIGPAAEDATPPDESQIDFPCALFVDVAWKPSDSLPLDKLSESLEQFSQIEKQVAFFVARLAGDL